MSVVAGARRTPGRPKTGGVPPKPPATIFISLWPSLFWDFGSLFRTLRRHFLTRCRGSRLLRLRLNPKEARERARAQLQNGYYISTSGRNSTRVLHSLGACYMVPGIDYPRYAFSGAQMPKQRDFDSICKLCSRKGAGIANGDSDVTQTSSSSEEGQ